MLQEQKEYLDEYGDVPINSVERVDYLLSTLSLFRAKTSVYDEIKRIGNIQWKELSYTIYMVPKGTPRPRLGMNGVFYVKGAKNNKKLFQKFIEQQDMPMIRTPIKFYCSCYLPIPKSMSSVEKVVAELGFIRPISKPDWDNLAKTYCDMIQDSLIYDDSLIIEGSTKKFYSIKPRIEIRLLYAEEYDCPFNRKKMK